MSTRVLHVSDLHFGRNDKPEPLEALGRLVEEARPELVIASGDLTHRGRRDQHEVAHAFLTRLGPPIHAIPGNHDIPYTFPDRFTGPWREFERLWETTEPTYSADGLFVLGLNSVRPWRHQSGALRREHLRRACETLGNVPESAFKIVTFHHHLLGAPWRSTKKPVSERNRVLATLVDSGAELILAGHIHQVAVSERREFEVTEGDVRAVVVSIAPGLGQPRPHRRGEARGLHLYEIDESSLTVRTYIWRVDDWGLTAVRRFPRGREPLAVDPVT